VEYQGVDQMDNTMQRYMVEMFGQPENEYECQVCYGTGRVLRARWTPDGNEEYIKSCSTCGGSGYSDEETNPDDVLAEREYYKETFGQGD
jgi:hypothetical protein